MDVRKGKLAEYVMYSEAFNRYEEFAADSENFATIDSSQDTTTDQGSFELYVDGSSEKRVLVKSNHVYGSSRQVERVVFDIAHSDSTWVTEGSAVFVEGGGNGGYTVEGFDASLQLGVRPILTDFETDEITWKKAITDAEVSFGTQTWISIAEHGGTGSVIVATLSTDGGSMDIGDTAEADVEVRTEFPGLLVCKYMDAGENWNGYSAVYGWELRLGMSGSGTSAEWTGFVGGITRSVGFAILK